MALPITVLTRQDTVQTGSPNKFGFRPNVYVESVTKTKQPAPYNKVAYYDRHVTRGRGSSSDGSNDSWTWNINLTDNSSIKARAQQRALNKLKSNAYDSADIFVGLIEARDSFDMIAKRTGQLYQFTKAVKRFDFASAATILNMKRRPKGLKPNAKSAASNWLEYWLGWAPLVGDIGNAISVLQSPYKTLAVKSSGSDSTSLNVRTRIGSLPGDVSSSTEVYTWNVRCHMAMEYFVSNPNLHLANQLGFVNPYTVAWELVPMSFVVDWFANVGDFLGQWTMFAGLTSVSQRTTYLHKQKKTYDYRFDSPKYERTPLVGGGEFFQMVGRNMYTRNGNADRFHMERFNTVATTIKLGFNIPPGLSPTRGLTGISLLLGAMPR